MTWSVGVLLFIAGVHYYQVHRAVSLSNEEQNQVNFVVQQNLHIQPDELTYQAPVLSTVALAGANVGGPDAPNLHDKIYIVKAGDTLSDIAQAYGLSATSFVIVNNLTNANSLEIGQKLTIPDHNVTATPVRKTKKSITTTTRLADIGAPIGTIQFIQPSPTAIYTSTYFNFITHPGTDLAGPKRGAVFASTAGCASVKKGYNNGYGNKIDLTDPSGDWMTRYAHLDSFAINDGDCVQQGDIIGYVGDTGNSTGPHLHFEIHYKGKAVNPAKYITLP